MSASTMPTASFSLSNPVKKNLTVFVISNDTNERYLTIAMSTDGGHFPAAGIKGTCRNRSVLLMMTPPAGEMHHSLQ
jgi:hypothetical protein